MQNTDYKSILVDKGIDTIIVEDELRSQQTLKKLLNQYCPQVNIIGLAGSVDEAVSLINELKPRLIFLDIALPDGDGFNVLEDTTFKDYKVIFVTAYDKYAIRAFEFSALHYLLKPISHIELQLAVKRFNDSGKPEELEFSKKISTLKENINSPEKLLLPTTQGFEVIALKDIVRMEANHNYTDCYLISQEHLLISKPLISFENILNDLEFVRVHNKHLINLKYVKKYFKGSGGSLVMMDGSEISVSKSRKNEFLEKLNDYARHL